MRNYPTFYLSIFLFNGSLISFLSPSSYADKITLNSRQGGNPVEVLEEQNDAFIVKIPKTEIARIERSSPTTAQAWTEKRVLWQDVGDYLVIEIPKERLTQKELAESPNRTDIHGSLPSIGSEKSVKRNPSSASEGALQGKVFKNKDPVPNCKVRIVLNYVAGGIANLFSLNKGKNSDNEVAFEAATDESGSYFFEGVPPGDYQIYFKLPDQNNWLRLLAEKPPVHISKGRTLHFRDTHFQ